MADAIKTAKKIFDQFLSKVDPESIVRPTEVPKVSVYMAQIGKKGGRTGGKHRMDALTSRQRKTLARKAARARWSKKSTSKQG
jgi:hypothetical protein